MGMQLLSGAGCRLMVAATVWSIWSCVAPVAAKAANPAFGSPVCAVQSVGQPPPAPPLWQIKGTVSVNNLPAGTMAVSVKIQFQKKAAGAANWVKMFDVDQTTTPVMGTASIDTGFQNFTPAPAQGDQYRILVSGAYILGGPPVERRDLTSVGSIPITPVP